MTPDFFLQETQRFFVFLNLSWQRRSAVIFSFLLPPPVSHLYFSTCWIRNGIVWTLGGCGFLFMFLKKKKICGKFEKNKQLNKWNDSTFEFRKFPHSKIRIPFIESLLPRCSSENFKDKTQLKFSNVHFFRFKFFFIDEDSFYTHPTPQHADLLQQWKVSLSVRVCLKCVRVSLYSSTTHRVTRFC